MLASPIVADPLRLLEICATSDGGAALVLTSMDYARKHSVEARCTIAGGLDRHAALSRTPSSRCRTSRPTRPRRRRRPTRRSATRSRTPPTRRPASVPRTSTLAEVYDLSTALELDWYENIGLCKAGEAERLLHDGDTTIGGRIPVNPSGGLACFGEADPRPGDRAGVRAHVAAARPGRRPPGRGRARRHHRQPGPVRPRLVGDRQRSHGATRVRRLSSSTPSARRSAGAAAAWPRCIPADLGAHVSEGAGRAQRHRPARGRRRGLRLRRHDRPAGRRHRAHVLARGGPARGGARAPPIDRQCGSSQQAVHFAAQAVMSGTTDVVVAGGVQNMSMIPISSAMTVGRAARLHRPVLRLGGLGRALRRPGGRRSSAAPR